MREHVNMSEHIYVRVHINVLTHVHRYQGKCLRELCALKWACQSTYMGVGDQDSVVVHGAMVSSREWGGSGTGSEAHTLESSLSLSACEGLY